MALNSLAGEIVRLASGNDGVDHSTGHGDRPRTLGRATPVLVVPACLSFRTPFFLSLSQAIADHTDRDVRIDLLRCGSGLAAMLGDFAAQRQAHRVNRAALRRSQRTRVQITSSIGRNSVTGPLVFGVCTQGDELPEWATPIPLGQPLAKSLDEPARAIA